MNSLFNQLFRNNRDGGKPGEIEYLNDKPREQENLKISAVIEGLVQGVGFRYSTYYLAKELGIAGVVKNRADGTVYVEAIGEEDTMEQFIRQLAKGPSKSANVEKVTIKYDNSIPDYTSFSQDR